MMAGCNMLCIARPIYCDACMNSGSVLVRVCRVDFGLVPREEVPISLTLSPPIR